MTAPVFQEPDLEVLADLLRERLSRELGEHARVKCAVDDAGENVRVTVFCALCRSASIVEYAPRAYRLQEMWSDHQAGRRHQERTTR